MVEESAVPGAPPAFKTADRRAGYFAAYDAVLARWPVPVHGVDVPSGYGTTHVQLCGPPDASPLVLLHGGGATSTVWFANVAALSRTHRVVALDAIGDAGRSVADGQRIRALPDLMGWLDATLDHLGLDDVRLCGHSYGGWLALNYALHAPTRVRRLALLDPTECFAGMSLSYRLHAVPLFVRPSEQRMRDFIGWETGGRPIDADWLTLLARGSADFRTAKVVLPHRPAADRLAGLRTPTLLLLAERSKSHDIRQVAANAHRLMPQVQTAVLPGVSHHGVPTEDPATLNQHLTNFFGGQAGGS
jgi:pimeloyl-ACP methyl ester carboxylesterase